MKDNQLTNECELEQCKNKIDNLHNWLESKPPSHPDWEQKRRELSIAIHKTKKIESRGKRPKTQIATTYSLPTIKY